MGNKAIDKDYLLTQLKNFNDEIIKEEIPNVSDTYSPTSTSAMSGKAVASAVSNKLNAQLGHVASNLVHPFFDGFDYYDGDYDVDTDPPVLPTQVYKGLVLESGIPSGGAGQIHISGAYTGDEDGIIWLGHIQIAFASEPTTSGNSLKGLIDKTTIYLSTMYGESTSGIKLGYVAPPQKTTFTIVENVEEIDLSDAGVFQYGIHIPASIKGMPIDEYILPMIIPSKDFVDKSIFYPMAGYVSVGNIFNNNTAGELWETRMAVYDIIETMPEVSNVYSPTSLKAMSGKAVASAVSNYLPKTGGTMNSEFTSTTIDGTGIEIDSGLIEGAKTTVHLDGVATTGEVSIKNPAGTVTHNLSEKYKKPSTGIPKSDLDSSVQATLGKADNALSNTTLYVSFSDVTTYEPLEEDDIIDDGIIEIM